MFCLSREDRASDRSEWKGLQCNGSDRFKDSTAYFSYRDVHSNPNSNVAQLFGGRFTDDGDIL